MALLLLALAGRSLYAGTPPPDSLLLRPGDYIIFEDSSFYAVEDTMLVIPEGVDYVSSTDPATRGDYIYDSINYWAADRSWLKNILKLLIVQGKTKSKPSSLANNEVQGIMVEHKGKSLRNIRVVNTDVFGTSINDTLYQGDKKLNRILNSTHLNTRSVAIKNNLHFAEGDEFDPETIKDNERLLRRLPYIDDARIIAVPVSETEVDLLVITKDVYAIGANLNLGNLKRGVISLYDLNMFGLGHRLQADAIYDYREDTERNWGYRISYGVENICGSFIKTKISYTDIWRDRAFGFSARHDLLTLDTKYSYGTSQTIRHTWEDLDTSILTRLNYHYQDYWLGRAYRIPDTRTRIILSGRYSSNITYDRPEIGSDEYHKLQTYSLYLASFALSREDYYKMNLIYNYGRTEDIPHGTLLSFTSGYESNEFFRSFYSGLEISAGSVLPKNGYMYFKAGLGGYYNEKVFNRGIVDVRTNYFTPLLKSNRYRIRQFLNISYTTGIRRFEDEALDIDRPEGITGFSSNLEGTQRLVAKTETVAFSPYYVYGFRFVFYGFADIGIIGESAKALFTNPVYSGIGIGLRIRNENLAFRTFQLRFAFYPRLPENAKTRMLSISGEPNFQPPDFSTYRPSAIRFR